MDRPRFCIKDGSAQGAISFEEGISDEVQSQSLASRHGVTLRIHQPRSTTHNTSPNKKKVVEELRRRGHVVLEETRAGYEHHATFGKAQVN